MSIRTSGEVFFLDDGNVGFSGSPDGDGAVMMLMPTWLMWSKDGGSSGDFKDDEI